MPSTADGRRGDVRRAKQRQERLRIQARKDHICRIWKAQGTQHKAHGTRRQAQNTNTVFFVVNGDALVLAITQSTTLPATYPLA